MAKTRAEMQAQLAEAESDWTVEAPPDRYIHPARAEEMETTRRREEANNRAIAERLAKESAARRQYAETERAFIAGIIGQDDDVDRLTAAVTAAQSEIATLLQERGRVIAQIGALEQAAVIDLSTVSMKELLATAASREKTRTVELGALIAVREELGRRLAEAEAGLAEAQHSLLRLQRVALHKHCDLLIEQLRHPLGVVVQLFGELRRTEDAVKGLGGPRQPFSNYRTTETLKHLVERWDAELSEIRRFSESYDR